MSAEDQFSKTAPLRLAKAAAIAFPDGSMTASGLRAEARRGNLVIERIAGKDFTTLDEIEHMRKKCRIAQKDQGCGSSLNPARPTDQSKPQSGLSETAQSSDALAL